MNLDNVDKLIEKNLKEIIDIRKDIHAHPELGMNEHRTSRIIYENLQGLGLKIQQGIGNTGVVALLEGTQQGKTILLRADMDALPINELTNLPFKSQNENIMHACGHDVHTSILLGVAKVLSNFKDEIKGNVKFVFQPAEECNPTGGANYMIQQGVLENPKVDAAVALHVWDMPLGKIGIKKGAMMAQSDRIYIKVKGKSAHGSEPHEGADAIVAAAYVTTALQTIVSRNIDPLDSAVVTLGVINGGYRYNVIADEVKLEGTVRSFSPDIANLMPRKIEAIIKNICAALDCHYEFKYIKGYPLTYNDENLTENVIEILKHSLGEKNIIIPRKPATIGEDFSFFNKYVPCTFMWLGCRTEINKDCCILHSPNLYVTKKLFL
ncbi:M20 metallopeptidase family protein [Clostridium tetanomorphum]|uniref:M20 metallopeptidase family protein n=1 Tax=Clostridium tetanomorphum TaxID=1553 RepID=UPI000D95A020|nr:amidohydrolase [Clostridium tetanomorphum]SQC01889.1 N-acyl-L-amino acid amidohydrolase [Clostridium tetanomorphum]